MFRYFLALVILFSCAKRAKNINKIDFLCEDCEVKHEITKLPETKPLEAEKETRRKPLIFEYDYLKEELNVRTYEEMFEKAMQFYSSGEIETSAKIFKVLVENAPNQRYKDISMFNLAMSIERLGEENDALKLYEELARSDDPEIKEDSILRAARIMIAQGKETKIDIQDFSDEKRKRFGQSILLLERTEKILSELLNGVKSFGIMSGENSHNQVDTQKLREINGIIRRLRSEIDGMMINPNEENETKTIIYLCRGNIYFIEAVLIPNTDKEKVKEKVKKLINAQREYFSAVKERQPWWMTAGVFKIGETYRYLFEDITSSPIPRELKNEQEKQIYMAELLKEIKRALDLAKDIYEKNINFSQRAKMKTVWIARSEEGVEKIKHYMELVQKFIEEIEKEEIQQ